MTYRGKVQGGVVILVDGVTLPEGMEVSVVPEASAAPPGSEAPRPGIWNKLAELGRAAENEPCDLPDDLAINHDHYLHGLPKKQ